MLCLPQGPVHRIGEPFIGKRSRSTLHLTDPPKKSKDPPKKSKINYSTKTLSSKCIGTYDIFFIWDTSESFNSRPDDTHFKLKLSCSCHKKNIHNKYFSNWVLADCTRYIIDPLTFNVIFRTSVPDLGDQMDLLSGLSENRPRSIKSFKRYMKNCLNLSSTSKIYYKHHSTLSSFASKRELDQHFESHGKKTLDLSINDQHILIPIPTPLMLTSPTTTTTLSTISAPEYYK